MNDYKNETSDKRKGTSGHQLDEQPRMPRALALWIGICECHDASIDDTLENESLWAECKNEIDILKLYYPQYKVVDVESIPAFIKSAYPDIRKRLKLSIEASSGMAVVS